MVAAQRATLIVKIDFFPYDPAEPSANRVAGRVGDRSEAVQLGQTQFVAGPLADDRDVLFVEVTVTVADASDFETDLHVRGEVLHGRYRVLSVESSSVPSAIAALLLWIRDTSGCRPHIHFEWTEGNPVANFVRYLIFGQGEVAPVAREMIRHAEPNRSRRPHVHVS